MDKRYRVNQPFDEQSSAWNNMAAPLEHPVPSMSVINVRSIFGRPLGEHGVRSNDNSYGEDSMEEIESVVEQKRRVASVESAFGLPVSLDYPGLGGLGEIFMDKRCRLNQPFDEQSYASHNMAAPWEHSTLSTSRTNVASVCRQPLKGRYAESDDNSDDGDVVGENESGVDKGTFGQALYQKSRAGVIVHYDDCGDDIHACDHCAAFFWFNEALKKKINNQLIYTHYCEKGRI